MGSTLLFILSILVFALVVLLIYQMLKIYVFDKVKINKWIILIIALVVFIAPPILFPTLPRWIQNYVFPGIFVILFLWFLDLCGFMKNMNTQPYTGKSKRGKKDDIKIKPKAKPNRVKKNN